MIGYPNQKSKLLHHEVRDNYMGRGMSLEEDLNKSNDYYRETDRALIHKKPIPVQIVKVDYPRRSAARITEAYYKTPSTTDYNGIYRGKAVDFEAKETKSKTSFPLKNIHPHQINHLEHVLKHGGIGFVIIRFTSLDETYLIDAAYMIQCYQNQDRKSIPYAEIKAHGSLIRRGYNPRLHYLDNVDELYFKEETANDTTCEEKRF